MKAVIFLAALFLLLSRTFISAQSPTPNMPVRPSAPGDRTTLLNGKVTTEGNTPPQESVTVILECMGSTAAQATTDPRGNFTITVRRPVRSGAGLTSEARTESGASGELSSCEISAKLAGYSAEPLHIASHNADIGAIDVGTLVLHHNSQSAETFAVSVNSLAAPEKAKAAFEKGEEQKRKGKLAAAMESFRKAIAAYPKYALAWLELGRVQATQNDFAEAQTSFRQSITQDSKLVDGYVELAHLAAQQGQWQDLLGATEHLVLVHPEVADFWFWSAAANFNLGDINKAETSITRGLRLDSAHHIPQMEYLYALVLARQQNFQAAADHTAAYLKLSPTASDATEAQTRLAQFRTLATTGGTK
jgi:tetratricopeptide (TPR) repeat protein